MRGGLYIDHDIFASAHVNDFVVDGKRMPLHVGTLVVALAVELFVVEILHVAQKRGESPGHVLVMAGDDKRQARNRDSGGMKARRAQVGHVPDVRHRELEVHIVREQRLATRSVAACNDPVVRAGHAAIARGLAEKSHQLARIFCGRRLRRSRIAGMGARLGILVIVFIAGLLCRRRHWPRLAEVHANACGLMVAPRPDGVEIGFKFWIVKLGGDVGTRQFRCGMHIKLLHHRETHTDGIDAAPGLRAIHQKPELDGERIGFLRLRDVEIDAAGIVVETRPVIWRQSVVKALGIETNLQCTLRSIVRDERRAQDLCQFTV